MADIISQSDFREVWCEQTAAYSFDTVELAAFHVVEQRDMYKWVPIMLLSRAVEAQP